MDAAAFVLFEWALRAVFPKVGNLLAPDATPEDWLVGADAFEEDGGPTLLTGMMREVASSMRGPSPLLLCYSHPISDGTFYDYTRCYPPGTTFEPGSLPPHEDLRWLTPEEAREQRVPFTEADLAAHPRAFPWLYGCPQLILSFYVKGLRSKP